MKKFYLLTIIALLGISQASWAATPVYNGGKWYALYDATEYSNTNHTYDVASPTDKTISAEWRKSEGGLWGSYGGYDLYVSYSSDGSTYSTEDQIVHSTIYEKYADYQEVSTAVGQDITNVKFRQTGTRTRFYRNVKVPFAKHIFLADGSAFGTTSVNMDLGSVVYGEESAKQHINLRSFYVEGTQIKYVLTGSPEFHFEGGETTKTFAIMANACAYSGGTADCASTNTQLGNPDNYELDIYYTPSANRNIAAVATLKIYDGETERASVALTAQSVLTYSVAFNANGGDGSMADQNFVYGVEQNLNANEFTRAYTVTFDANGGSCAETSANTTYEFLGWAKTEKGEAEYTNGQNVNNLTETGGATVNLFAKWSDGAIVLPEATKLGVLLDGWYDGETKVGDPGMKYNPSTNVTLQAHWAAKKSPYIVGENTILSVEEAQNAAFEFTNAANPVAHIEILSISEVNNGDGKVIEYDAENNKVIAHNAGIATIYFTQEETEQFSEYTSAKYTYTVNKHENTLYVNGSTTFSTSLYTGASLADIAFTATNTDYENSPILCEQTAGENFAVYSEESKTVTALWNAGLAEWHISQPENYYYAAGEGSFSINVTQAEEATDCYILEVSDVRTINTISTTENYTFDAAGAQLICQVRRVTLLGFSNDIEFYAEYSADGENWGEMTVGKLPSTDTWYDRSFAIPEDARFVRFETKTGATGYKEIRNVKITRKTYLKAENVQINTNIGVEGKAQLVVDYSLANGGDLKIACDNDKFVLSQYTVSDVDCKSGKATIDVSYTSDELIEDAANVVIYNNVYRAEAQLNATVSKLDQVITWTTDSITYGDTIANIASTNVEALTVTYSSSDETVIKVVDNQLVALSAGEAVITATTAETELYNAGESKQTIKVGKLAQEIIWTYEGDTILLVLKEEKDVFLTATSGLYVSLEADNDTVVDITEKYEEDVMVGFTLQALAEGSATLTASQEGDEHYLPATNILKIVVVKSEATGVENVQGDDVQCTKVRKIMHNGQIYIMYKGTMYDVQGNKIR